MAASGALAGAEIPLEAYGRLPTVDSMAVAPDGDRVAFRRTTDEMDAVFVLDRRSGDTGLGRDLRSLVVSTRAPGSEFMSYFEMDLDNGSVGPPLFERDDASVERPLVDTERRVYGVEYSGFFPRYEFFDGAPTERVRAIHLAMKSTAA